MSDISRLRARVKIKRIFGQGNRWKLRAAMMAVIDAAIVAASYFLGLLLRFDFMFSHIPSGYMHGYAVLIGPYIALTLVIFFVLKLYHSVWSFASVNELMRMIEAYVLIEGCVALIYVITRIRMPLSFWIIGGFSAFVLSTALRFSYRFARGVRVSLSDRTAGNKARGNRPGAASDRVMIVGAGDAGKVILHEYMTSSYLHTNVCCFIDDNKNKHGRYLDGVPIVGGRNAISRNVARYNVNKIVVAMPSASAQTRKEIIDICSSTGCKVQVVPGVYQLVDGEVSVSRLRDVQIEDLLGRDQVQVSLDEIRAFLQGKTVLVTGGGGSIGSELCRQIAASDPKMLIIFDVYENNAYAIQQELIRTYEGKLPLVTLIGSVRNTSRVNWVMETYRPDIVFHAAAHKHVPLMEDSPNEAIKNNAIGTYKLAQAAVHYGVKRFVMISTDKAVNPTNVMGASKRLCEMVVQMMNRRREALAADRKSVV